MEHPNIKLLLAPGCRDKLNSIEKESGVVIERDDKKGTITLFGSEANTSEALVKVNRLDLKDFFPICLIYFSGFLEK